MRIFRFGAPDLKSSELAANGLSPPGVGAGLGAPNIPPVGTPKGDAGAMPVDPNTLSLGVGADPNIDVFDDGCAPNKLLADGVGALPKMDDEVLAAGGAPNGLAGATADDVDPNNEDPDGAVAPKIDAPLGAAVVSELPNIDG